MHRFYAPAERFADRSVSLDVDETHHLRDVLRLHAGDEVSVFDGAGREFWCVVREIKKRSSVLDIAEQTKPTSPESPFQITLAATVVNGEKYDLVIQKAVELGVVNFVPLYTARCEVKLKDAIKRVGRWRRIAMEATKQCGRAKLMDISEPMTFNSLIAADNRRLILFSERDGGKLKALNGEESITIVIGPKGGWDDAELDAGRSKGVTIVTLGGRILRAETAAIRSEEHT